MRTPPSLSTITSEQMYTAVCGQLVLSTRPLIKKMVTKSFRMYLDVIKEKETQYGFLYFIHGDTIASEYTRGNEFYFKEHYNSGIEKVTDWLCEQLVHEPQGLMRGSLKSIAYAFSHIKYYYHSLNHCVKLSPLAERTIYQPVPKAYKRLGVAILMRLKYYPFPMQRFNELGENSKAFSYGDIMHWIHLVSQKSIQVSLTEAKSFLKLTAKQDEKLSEQRFHMLDSIVSCMLESMSNKALPIFSQTNHIHYIKSQSLDMEYFHDICKETFTYAETYLKEDLYRYASSIIWQLNNDFVHHGLGFDAEQLAHLLHSVLYLKEGRLIEYKSKEEVIFNDEAVKRLLAKYQGSDQLHMLIHQHRMSEEERNERKMWHTRISSMSLPNRVRRVVMDNVIKFNEFHIVLKTMDMQSLNHRINVEGQSLYDYDGYLAFLASYFLEQGGSVKHVIKAYQHFSLAKDYLSRYDLGMGRYFYTYNDKSVHDFYEVVLPVVLDLFNTLKTSDMSTQDKKTLCNTFLKAMVTYNLKNANALWHFTSQLRQLQQYIKKEVLSHSHVLVNIDQKTSLSKMLSLCTQANMIKNNKDVENVMSRVENEQDERGEGVDIRLTWEHLNMASNMAVQDAYLDLYKMTLDSKRVLDFTAPNPTKEVLMEEDSFKVGVYAHNNPIGVLGAGVKGVCISLNSHYRHEQLHPAFMNLCVHDDEKVVLWGLLCRASNKNETVYILNNFQGSINDKKMSKYDVRKMLINALKEFVKDNDVASVLIRDQSFNAINLGEGQKRVGVNNKKYRLERATRLDFSVLENGIVDEDSFYEIK